MNETLAEIDFTAFKRKVKDSYGVDLNAYKRQQMERRLRANMDRCGVATFVQYYSYMQRNKAVLDEFLDRLTINVSELFRNPEQFDILQAKVIPELTQRARSLRIWSAGCSYGAEPYSLAILLNETVGSGRHSIIATDIDDKMLARAKEGLFQPAEVKNVTPQRLQRYFTSARDGYQASSALKLMISFGKHNMLEDKFKTGLDLIVCRNVVIYFTDEAKEVLYRRFYESLTPGGYLFVGGTERITSANRMGFENTYPFFYRKPLAN